LESIFFSLIFAQKPYIYLRTDSHYLKSLKQVSSFVKGFSENLPTSPVPQFLEDFEHLPPEQLLSAIMEKDARIRWLMAEIKGVLNQDKME